MLHSRCNIKIKYLHQRCLQFIYNEKSSSVRELLQKDQFVPIQYKNIKEIAIDMFKFKDTLAPDIVKDIFAKQYKNH